VTASLRFSAGAVAARRPVSASRRPESGTSEAVSTTEPVSDLEGSMYCQNCGKELHSGALSCASCGAVVPGVHVGAAPASVKELLAEARRAARDLVSTTTTLSAHLATKAEAAAKDPSGSAKKAVHRVAKELDAAARELDRILRDL